MTNARFSQETSFTDSGANLSMDEYLDENNVFKFKEFLAKYSDPSNAPMFKKNVQNTYSINERLRFTYRSDDLEITLGGRVGYNNTTYSINKEAVGQKNGVADVKTWSNMVDGSINWTLSSAGLTFKTDARYNWYIGYTTPMDPILTVNMDIQKLLFKNKMTLALRAYDLLDQARTISESNSNGVRTERWSNTLGRYVIVALTYRFGSFGKRGNNMRMGPGGPGMGRPGMGGPPMGGGRPPMR